MIYRAYLNQNKFHKALDKENEEAFLYDMLRVVIYFYLRNKMKEEQEAFR